MYSITSKALNEFQLLLWYLIHPHGWFSQDVWDDGKLGAPETITMKSAEAAIQWFIMFSLFEPYSSTGVTESVCSLKRTRNPAKPLTYSNVLYNLACEIRAKLWVQTFRSSTHCKKDEITFRECSSQSWLLMSPIPWIKLNVAYGDF